jgi:hypothetical protein
VQRELQQLINSTRNRERLIDELLADRDSGRSESQSTFPEQDAVTNPVDQKSENSNGEQIESHKQLISSLKNRKKSIDNLLASANDKDDRN